MTFKTWKSENFNIYRIIVELSSVCHVSIVKFGLEKEYGLGQKWVRTLKWKGKRDQEFEEETRE